jgi:predicted nucleic acid-binding protein
MIRVLLDTSVWISLFGSRRSTERGERARTVLAFLEDRADRFTVCYSERTVSELSKPIPELERFERVPYHTLDENWNQIDGSWGNIGSDWDNSDESPFAESAKAALPDKSTRPNPRRDRGICADAAFSNCRYLLTEDRSDFSKLKRIASDHGLHVMCLLDLSAREAIDILDQNKA